MPEFQTADEVLAVLADYIGEDKDRARQIGKAILGTQSTRPLAEVLKKRGFNDANQILTKSQGQVAELEKQVRELTEALEEKNGALQQVQSAQPEWSRRIRETEEKYQKRERDLANELEAEKQARRTDALETHRQKFLTLIMPQLSDDDYAIYTALPKYGQYIDLDERGQLLVKEPGENVPYDPARGDPMKQLVADALEEIPSKYRAAPAADAGGGSTTKNQQGPQRARTVEEIKEKRKASGIYAM